MKYRLALFLFTLSITAAYSWGFFAHQRINRQAVFSLPPEMIVFFKKHIVYITEKAVNPDKRRYAVEGEAPRHYIDVDVYDKYFNDSAVYKMPRFWSEAVAMFSEDTLQAYGIVPWHVERMRYRLTDAFRRKDAREILRLSADIGHYIADANVPLHTTENYNGQLTGQRGIHGLWESRLPELFFEDYDLWVGKAEYIDKPQLHIWQGVVLAHEAVDSVFTFERKATEMLPPDKKYSFIERNGITVRTYSYDFCELFHRLLAGQVERRLRASIKMVADFWFTCWVDAGQPDLRELLDFEFTPEELEQMKKEEEEWEKAPKVPVRPHEAYRQAAPSGMPAYAHACPHNALF
ncbi:MAG: hypothetical protein KatS3mg033_2134 [Thermonema sp.]|uniref:zinc dependent phospholipase C family protein n=1 Tax=Thermonema sp. TaxID=2231181 RepID=UPI0021DC833C|nr:zinc dependent phospholipase C family protein [Thermonema sp.]GIV40334.1 MAG: hypothetical protein KatS3mg033_2134 [Thermonema sp.]